MRLEEENAIRKRKADAEVWTFAQLHPAVVEGTVAGARAAGDQHSPVRPGRKAVRRWTEPPSRPRRGGRPFDKDVYSRAFFRLSHEAGLPRIKLHGIRQTIASELHDRESHRATGAPMLRHSTETHLRNYVRSSDGHRQAAVAAFRSCLVGRRLKRARRMSRKPVDVTRSVTQNGRYLDVTRCNQVFSDRVFGYRCN